MTGIALWSKTGFVPELSRADCSGAGSLNVISQRQYLVLVKSSSTSGYSLAKE